MATQQFNYVNGSLLNDFYINGLLYNRDFEGVFEVGQSPNAIAEAIDAQNKYFIENRGFNPVEKTDFPRKQLLYEGDPTVSATVQNVVDLGGGQFRLNFSDPSYVGFRQNDQVYLGWAQNEAQVVVGGQGHIVVQRSEGYAPISVSSFPAGSRVIQSSRSIAMRGTTTPIKLESIPSPIYNYYSIIDDGHQANIVDRSTSVPIKGDDGFLRNAAVQRMLQRFYRNKSNAMFNHQVVNPETNGFALTKMNGIHNQIKQNGSWTPFTSLPTKNQLLAMIRQWYINTPSTPMGDRVLATGLGGFDLLAQYFQDLLKFDSTIAVTFTDGTVSGLNATKIYIPGYIEPLQVVRWPFLDFDAAGEKTTVPGYAGLNKSSFSFYCLDFSPAVTRTGMSMPAFSNHYYGDAKYYFSFNPGLQPMTMNDIAASATPLSEGNLSVQATDRDFDNMRIWSMCMTNVNKPQHQMWLENKA